MKQTQYIRYITKIAVLSAVAVAIMLFEIPLPFIAPPFYKIDFSEVVVFIGAFALGPAAGVLIELLKNILNLLINSTTTAYVGEFANFLTGCVLVLPAAWLYHRSKSRKNAIIGMLIGTIAFAGIGVILNYFLLIPTFAKLLEMPVEQIVALGTKIFPFVDSLGDLVLFCVAPFNLIKGVAVSLITFVLYKHVAPILKKSS